MTAASRPTVVTVRQRAAEVLLALERGRTTLAVEIERARGDVPDPRDRALLLELTGGTLRWRLELDAIIAAASRRSVRSINERALAVLRLGVYQIRHLTRVPPHAIVNESVEAVRALGAPRAAGFVNAVLRAVLRRGPALALPSRPGPEGIVEQQVRYLSITLSHPAWLVRRWLDRYGFDATERWCQFNNEPPRPTVRPTGGRSVEELRSALQAEGIDAEPAPFAPGALRLPAGALGQIPPSLREQLFVQDEGAQLVARAVAARPGERVLDVCGAPGGKTLMCADDLGLAGDTPSSASLLVAADFRPARVATLAGLIAHAKVRAPVVRLDARQPLPFGVAFDAVLLDAPCSGLGTLRRDPDLKWTRREEDLPPLADQATVMLDHAAAAVRPGGRLIYATCSSEPDENAEVVGRFLAAHPGFAIRPIDAPGPVSASGWLETLPFRDGLDAFFAAVLVRRETA